jgi:hypothetical protein
MLLAGLSMIDAKMTSPGAGVSLVVISSASTPPAKMLWEIVPEVKHGDPVNVTIGYLKSISIIF